VFSRLRLLLISLVGRNDLGHLLKFLHEHALIGLVPITSFKLFEIYGFLRLHSAPCRHRIISMRSFLDHLNISSPIAISRFLSCILLSPCCSGFNPFFLLNYWSQLSRCLSLDNQIPGGLNDLTQIVFVYDNLIMIIWRFKLDLFITRFSMLVSFGKRWIY